MKSRLSQHLHLYLLSCVSLCGMVRATAVIGRNATDPRYWPDMSCTSDYSPWYDESREVYNYCMDHVQGLPPPDLGMEVEGTVFTCIRSCIIQKLFDLQIENRNLTWKREKVEDFVYTYYGVDGAKEEHLINDLMKLQRLQYMKEDLLMCFDTLGKIFNELRIPCYSWDTFYKCFESVFAVCHTWPDLYPGYDFNLPPQELFPTIWPDLLCKTYYAPVFSPLFKFAESCAKGESRKSHNLKLKCDKACILDYFYGFENVTGTLRVNVTTMKANAFDICEHRRHFVSDPRLTKNTMLATEFALGLQPCGDLSTAT